MGKKINIAIYPDYNEIFGDEKDKEDLEYFLKDIPTVNIIQLVSFISACLDINICNFKIQNFILTGLLGRLNRKEQLSISHKINSINDRVQKIVFHPISCLLILQVSTLNFKPGRKKEFSSENARNILKAFLYCNSIYSKKMKGFIPGLSELNDTEKNLGLFITMDVAQKYYFNPVKDIFEQSYKLKYFDEFLKNDIEIGGKYYEEFIKHKNVTSLLEIIKFTWNVYFKIISFKKVFESENVKYIINVDDNDQLILEYFDSISIIEDELKIYKQNYKEFDLDFKLIREKPLFKLNEKQFVVLSSNYFADKIFLSLMFEYFKFIKQCGFAKKFEDFKSYYSEIFVEKYLLQTLLDFVFEKVKIDIKQSGDILKKKDKYNKDYSDYYIRKKNKILLFECKDRLMKAETKYSYDFEKVSKDINEKFIEVGVDQFLKIIMSISNLEIPFEILKDVDLKNLIIIPIIVYTDITYSARGINQYINIIFEKKLQTLKLDLKIQDIVLIHIDTIINYQELFHSKKVDFINVLERYNRYTKKLNEKDPKSHDLIDFDSYLNEYIKRERKIKYSENNFIKNLHKELYL